MVGGSGALDYVPVKGYSAPDFSLALLLAPTRFPGTASAAIKFWAALGPQQHGNQLQLETTSPNKPFLFLRDFHNRGKAANTGVCLSHSLRVQGRKPAPHLHAELCMFSLSILHCRT